MSKECTLKNSIEGEPGFCVGGSNELCNRSKRVDLTRQHFFVFFPSFWISYTITKTIILHNRLVSMIE